VLYISKGILLGNPKGNNVSVSHCGALHRLNNEQAAVWLNGQRKPSCTQTAAQETALIQLSGTGIAEHCDSTEKEALFRLLVNCAICPVQRKFCLSILTRYERRLLKWTRYAGLRLTIAELTLLTERNIKPDPSLLGAQNRQALTETIYFSETISDGILETMMEKSSSRDDTVRAVLGLLKKKKIYLI